MIFLSQTNKFILDVKGKFATIFESEITHPPYPPPRNFSVFARVGFPYKWVGFYYLFTVKIQFVHFRCLDFESFVKFFEGDTLESMKVPPIS